MDSDAREPVKQAARDTVIRIKAQVSYQTTAGTSERGPGGQGGPTTDARGRLVFLTKDLTKNSITWSRGDRIIKIGVSTVEHYLSRRENAAHNGGHSELQMWDFVDHDPVKK